MTMTMFDTVTVPDVPSFANTSQDAVAGYIDGRFNDFAQLAHDFPHAHHLTIAVTSADRARCLDVEPGDASNNTAPIWFRDHADRSNGPPVFYTSASNVGPLVWALERNGIHRNEYLIWSAHYGKGEHICSPSTCGFPLADGTQWTDHALGRNLDQSLIGDHFFETTPPPAPAEHPTGVAVAKLMFDTKTFHWTVTPQAGSFQPGGHPINASLELQLDLANGRWRARGLEWNAPPLGKP